MEDKKLIRKLKKNDEQTLAIFIERYSAYVSAVIANQMGSFSDTETIEELASDTFYMLWQSRHNMRTAHVRGWLGTVARNKAKSYLRKSRLDCQTLDESYMLTVDDTSFTILNKKEQGKMIENALSKMESDERDTLVRYYYYNQTISAIAEETGINRETVKSRLRRGRIKLRTILEQGGYCNEY